MIKATAIFLASVLMILCVAGCTLPLAESSVPPVSEDVPSESQPPAPSSSETSPESSEIVLDMPVTLYLPNENADGFVTEEAMTDGMAEHIVSLLVEHHALPEGCALLAFSAEGTSGTADLNAAYGQAINQGTTGEYLAFGAVVNTLLVFFELDELTITIEGEVPETGHEIYDRPLHFHENQVSDLPVYPANDLSGAVAGLPQGGAVEVVWNRLSGYWTAADGLFVAFVYQDGIPGMTYGVWESEGAGFGELADGIATGEYTADLTIRFPATEATEMDDAKPEKVVTVTVDISGLDQDGKINIQVDGHGNGEMFTYAYGGATSEEAYASVH
jgi:hypothetical protein